MLPVCGQVANVIPRPKSAGFPAVSTRIPTLRFRREFRRFVFDVGFQCCSNCFADEIVPSMSYGWSNFERKFRKQPKRAVISSISWISPLALQ
jgi:hypothetical protein